ncbi:MAG TPA: sulfotransferase [Pirellulales bacterium]|nr:sulfotransferase [Pirellulales bacterium]
MGRLETTSLERQLQPISVTMPIYVSGLARSGSTLLHEVIASHPSVATHRVKDYPFVFTPFWWRRATAKTPPGPPRERAHQDGVMVTSQTPDALEEMLWMAFFPRCHDPSASSVLGRGEHHPAFETFHEAHLRKLLLAEGRTRYAAKANYHVARLAYLVRMYPDARFVVPVRAPEAHVASLKRQQEWFSWGQRSRPPSLAFMRRSGHFEFGLDRRAMQLDDETQTRRIGEAWAAGDDARGLAIAWNAVYGYLARLLEADEAVRAATLIVRFESMCDSPEETFRSVFDHCRLPNADEICRQRAAGVRAPKSASNLSVEELTAIRQETADVARHWGY